MQQRCFIEAIAVFVLPVLAVGQAEAENITFPPDAGVVNVVTRYGADPVDNGNDDTPALLRAIRENLNKHKILYFPNGVYNVRQTLWWRDTSAAPASGTPGFGGWGRFLSFQGQSQNGVVLKLRDRTFVDPARPQAVIMTASGDDFNQYDNTDGRGNQAFGNYLQNLTVDVGANNPGAIGIDYQVSNYGALRNVTIRSGDPAKQGHTGLSMTRRDNGPGLIQNVRIEGFDTGIRTKGEVYSLVLENVALAGQNTVGVDNDAMPLSIRALASTNAVPVLRSRNSAHVVLLDSHFAGTNGASVVAAVDNANNASRMLVRNLVTSSYARAIRSRGVDVSGAHINEWVSDGPNGVHRLFTSPPRTLNLPVRETPSYRDENLGNWRSVGVPSGSDDTAAIQNALNSGAPTVYFPGGTYRIRDTLTVPTTIKHLVGLSSRIEKTMTHLFTDGRPFFRFADRTGADTTFVEGFRFNAAPGVFAGHASARTLVLRDIGGFGGDGFRGQAGAGALFLENVAATGRLESGQTVWARQLNPEGGGTKLHNNGAILWILGLKTEGGGTAIETRDGGKTEVLGGQLYPAGAPPAETAAFVSHESGLSVSFAGTSYAANNFYPFIVRETRNGVTRELPRAQVPRRTFNGANVNLYAGYAPPRRPSPSATSKSDATKKNRQPKKG